MSQDRGAPFRVWDALMSEPHASRLNPTHKWWLMCLARSMDLHGELTEGYALPAVEARGWLSGRARSRAEAIRKEIESMGYIRSDKGTRTKAPVVWLMVDKLWITDDNSHKQEPSQEDSSNGSREQEPSSVTAPANGNRPYPPSPPVGTVEPDASQKQGHPVATPELLTYVRSENGGDGQSPYPKPGGRSRTFADLRTVVEAWGKDVSRKDVMRDLAKADLVPFLLGDGKAINFVAGHLWNQTGFLDGQAFEPVKAEVLRMLRAVDEHKHGNRDERKAVQAVNKQRDMRRVVSDLRRTVTPEAIHGALRELVEGGHVTEEEARNPELKPMMIQLARRHLEANPPA